MTKLLHRPQRSRFRDDGCGAQTSMKKARTTPIDVLFKLACCRACSSALRYGKETIRGPQRIEKRTHRDHEGFYRIYTSPTTRCCPFAGPFDVGRTYGWWRDTFGPHSRPQSHAAAAMDGRVESRMARSVPCAPQGDRELWVGYHIPGGPQRRCGGTVRLADILGEGRQRAGTPRAGEPGPGGAGVRRTDVHARQE